MKDVHGYVDGPLQQNRDRQMLQHQPFKGFPNAWADPALQAWMWGYDAFDEAGKSWEKYARGEWAGTAGRTMPTAKL